MAAGTSPTLSLKVHAPEAIAQFDAMTASARALRGELSALQQSGTSAGGGNAAITRLESQVKELTAGLRASQAQVEALETQIKSSSVEAQRALRAEAAEEKAKNKAAQDGARETARVKKQAAKEAADAERGALANLPTFRANGLSFAGGQVAASGADIGGLTRTQAADLQTYIARHAEEMRVRAAGVLEARAIAENEARTRALGVARVQAENENESRIRAAGVTQYKALTDNETRTRAMGALQARAQMDHEARERALGLAHVAAIAEDEARTRRLAGLQIAAAIEDARREETAARERALLARKEQTVQEAKQRATEGTARSAARGAAGASGAMFLTYGQNIPALAATFGAGMAIKESISEGAAFEKTMAFVRIASEDTRESIAATSKELIQMARNGSLFKPTELAEGLRKLAEAGFETRDAMTALTPVMSLATLGETSVAKAAEITQGMMHAFNLTAADSARIGDVMAKAANISATNVLAMGEAMKQSSSVASRYNLTIEDQGTLLAILAKQNITGSAAGTSLMNMFRELDPTTVRAKHAMDQIKFSAYDAATGGFKPMVQIVQELAQKLKGFDDKGFNRFLDDAFNNRGSKLAFAAIKDANADLPKFRVLLEEASKGTGYMAQSMLVLGDTADGAFKRLKSSAEAAFTEAFNSKEFTSSLNAMAAAVADPKFISSVTALVSAFGYLVAKAIELAAPLGTAAEGIKYLIDGYGRLETSVTSFFRGTDTAAASSSLISANGGVSALAGKGGMLGMSIFGGWLPFDFLGKINTIGAALRGIFSFGTGGVGAGPALELEQRLAKLDATIKGEIEGGRGAGTAGGGSAAYKAAVAERQQVAIERMKMLEKMKLPPSGRLPDVDPYEVDGRQASSNMTGIVAAGAKKEYDRINGAEEQAKRARIDQQDALAKIELAKIEAQAKREQATLDAKHRYGLISEAEYTDEIESLNERRAAKVSELIAVEMIAQQKKIAGLKMEGPRITETTKLLQLQARAAAALAAAEGVREDRELRLAGEQKKRDDANRGAAAAYMSDLEKIAEAQELSRRKAREAIDNELLSGSDAAANTARLAVEQAYMATEAKLRRDIAQLTAEDTQASREKLAVLEPILRMLEKQRQAEEDTAAVSARANRERQREFSYGWRQAYQKYVEDATNSAQMARDMFSATTKSMEDALVKFAQTGKLSFKDFANSVIVELERIIAKKAAAGIMGAIFDLGKMVIGSIGGSPGITGSAGLGASDLGGISAGLAHSGGVAGGVMEASRNVNAALFGNATRYHGGGIVPGEVPIIAKHGEGIFTPEQMSHLQIAGQSQGQGNVQINVTVNADTGETDVKADGDKKGEALGKRMAEVARAVIQQERRPGGLLQKGSS